MANNTIPERRNYKTSQEHQAALDKVSGPKQPNRADYATDMEYQQAMARYMNGGNPPVDSAQSGRAAVGVPAGIPQANPIQAVNVNAATESAIKSDITRGQTDKMPGQENTAGIKSEPPTPIGNGGSTPVIPGGTPAQSGGTKPLGPKDTYDAMTPGGTSYKAFADPTYTNVARTMVPKASSAWYNKGDDYTADGGINWKGTGDLEKDHPDWWGEVKNYGDGDKQAMIDDYKSGNEAMFQSDRDRARAGHMVASGWANADGTPTTDTVKDPDPEGRTAHSAWMNNGDAFIDSGTPTTPANAATGGSSSGTANGTRTQPTTPPDGTGTETVSTGDIGGVFPKSAANAWIENAGSSGGAPTGDPGVDDVDNVNSPNYKARVPKF